MPLMNPSPSSSTRSIGSSSTSRTRRAARPRRRICTRGQDERFKVRAGVVGVRLGRERRQLVAGDVLEIPRGTPHALWNAGDAPARAVWTTAPAGRTLEWFRALDAQRPAGVLDFAPLLVAYPDVFRLAGPHWLIRPALGLLAFRRRPALIEAT
jgi:hypothetical protein